MFKYIILVLMFAVSTAQSHVGHEHAPGVVMAPHGGYMEGLETSHLEFVTQGSKVKIYLYGKDMTPKNVAQIKVTAMATFPRKEPQAISLKEQGDHWEAQLDSKGEHRVTLGLTIHQDGHEEKVKYTVELQK